MNPTATNPEERERRTLRLIVLLVGCVATLVGLFYATERGRGRTAWEQCRRELEAKGAVLDWAAYVPPAVPDEQNIFKAPKIAQWFVKYPGAMGSPFPARSLPPYGNTNLLVVAELIPFAPGQPGNNSNSIWRIESATTPEKARALLQEVLGGSLFGAQGSFLLVARSAEEVSPGQILLETDETLTTEAIRKLFPDNKALPGTSTLRIEPSGSNSFLALFSPPRRITAADYLAWTDTATGSLQMVREALKRPYARIDSDYKQPYPMPIPNFITVRTVAQVLSQRAQSYLLLDQPEEALAELTLLHDLSRLLEAQPTGKPMTLVAAMIEVAITGLYTSVIADGLRLHAWREPQLISIQEQLRNTNLLEPFVHSFETERAALCYTLESSDPDRLFNLFGGAPVSARDKVTSPYFWATKFGPRGWVYRNMTAIAIEEQKVIECVNVGERRVLTSKAEALAKEVQYNYQRFSPYRYLAVAAVPNYYRATQTTARNQNLVNEALVACGLERYCFSHGSYPESLEGLVPQFVTKLPHDIITGGSFMYRLTGTNSFRLYSVGWNGKDDGGVTGKSLVDGDWVWGGPL